MPLKKICKHWDIAVGHTDIQGNPITGTIQSSSTTHILWIDASKSWDLIIFPSHPHALDWLWNPINYRSHSIPAVWTAKLHIDGAAWVRDGDTVSVADEAWWDAVIQWTQNKLFSN